MFFKKLSITILLAAVLMAPTGVLRAQTESELAVTRTGLQADRQAVVAANLPMTEAEAAAFWPVYRAYREEMALIGDKVVQTITTYAKSYVDASVTEEQSVALTKDYLKLRKAAIELKEKYVSRFAKVLPGRSVMRFYQIENKLDAVMDVAVMAEIPLVEQ